MSIERHHLADYIGAGPTWEQAPLAARKQPPGGVVLEDVGISGLVVPPHD